MEVYILPGGDERVAGRESRFRRAYEVTRNLCTVQVYSPDHPFGR